MLLTTHVFWWKNRLVLKWGIIFSK
jgi:hypothetical protein